MLRSVTSAIVGTWILAGQGSRDWSAPDDGVSVRSVVTRLAGNQGLRPVMLRAPPGGRRLVVDASAATFILANSRNPAPTAPSDCNNGMLAVNPYPLRLKGGQGSVVRGGRFVGRVPQGSEWRATYCNSAAILIEEVDGGTIEGVRIARAWDGVRAGRGTSDLHIARSWISDVRDDAFEDDHLQSLVITDTLIDGAFQLVSAKPAKGATAGDGSGRTILLSGVVARLGDYPYGAETRFGALMKSDKRSPRLQVVRSVIAISGPSLRTFDGFWKTGWSKLERSSGNLLLWLSDEPMPTELARPRPGFVIMRGREARAAWRSARRNWIDCHPDIGRIQGDDRPDPRRCRKGNWGGVGQPASESRSLSGAISE
ncbi:hypothetical protein GCM10022280_18280 [Sphingomonas swuensis]|uniref:Phosphodiester glycosidase domain-containing protein n=1 Tax=Sphingomonas swuensis TaxID=977800 RepID=A0ABP7SZT2_9SPHN